MCHCVFVITLSIKCLLKSVTLLLRDCEDHCAKNEDCVTSVKCYSVCCGGLYGGLCVCLIGWIYDCVCVMTTAFCGVRTTVVCLLLLWWCVIVCGGCCELCDCSCMCVVIVFVIYDWLYMRLWWCADCMWVYVLVVIVVVWCDCDWLFVVCPWIRFFCVFVSCLFAWLWRVDIADACWHSLSILLRPSKSEVNKMVELLVHMFDQCSLLATIIAICSRRWFISVYVSIFSTKWASKQR